MALGRVVPPRRAIAASSAPEGEQVWLGMREEEVSVHKVVRDTDLDPISVIEHDSGLRNRCSPSRFREIAIDNLSLPGRSTSSFIAEQAKKESQFVLWFAIYRARPFRLSEADVQAPPALASYPG